MNKKVVNIYPTTPVLSTNPPIRTMAYKITKPIKDIRACIIAGAKVEEVLPNGSTIRLNLNNYDKDHIAIYNKIKSKESETTLKPIKTEVSKNVSCKHTFIFRQLFLQVPYIFLRKRELHTHSLYFVILTWQILLLCTIIIVRAV